MRLRFVVNQKWVEGANREGPWVRGEATNNWDKLRGQVNQGRNQAFESQ